MDKVSSGSAEERPDAGRVDLVLETLLSVHEHDGNAKPVLKLEPVVAVDEDLLEVEGDPLAFGEHDGSGLVAQSTGSPGVHEDRMHGNAIVIAGDGAIGSGKMTFVGPEGAYLDDLELQRRVQQGDPLAFEALYRRYGPAAYGLARRVTGQATLAQDVVHDAYMALWRAPEAYDPARGPFRTFFLSLVHHRAVDTVRREERLRRRTERALNPSEAADEDVAEGIVEEAWLVVRRGEVRQALQSLPQEQRHVLELAYFRGYTQARIAEELGIPLGTVKTRTLAAMRKLRRVLSELGENE
jgi:RNA polymerase sigma-70 factor (ECF subfamily)